MWYGQSWNDTAFAKIVGLKKWAPELYIEVIDGDETHKCDFIEWELQGIELGSYEYEWKERETYKLKLSDKWEKIMLSTSWNRVSRAIINCLASIENFSQVIKISVYRLEKNGKVYNNVGIWVWGQLVNWKYSREQQKEFIRIVKDPETDEYIKSDYSALDEKLKEEIKEINSRVLQAPAKEEEDLPFN